MSEWHQQVIKYKNHLGKEQLLGTFWIDENGDVDIDNMLTEKEMAMLLQFMRIGKVVEIESTGNWIKD